MKKIVLIMAILMFTASLAFSAFVEIGTGTGYTPTKFPFYNYYENNRSQTLYLQSELGSAQTFTKISFDIQRVAASGYQELVDFTVNFLLTDDTAMTPGDYHDMTGATEVFYNASYTLATATGWNDIDITDFAYNGTQNLIVEIIWGDQGQYTSTYYRNYKTDDGSDVVRTLYGYADGETPPNYDGSSTYYSNIKFHYEVPYGVVVNQLTPNADVNAGTSFNYFIEIENAGTNNDTYDLASAGGSWTYEIRDKDDAGVISTLSVNAGEKDTCIVKVTVPPEANFGDTDTETFTATSQGDPSVSDNCSITTTALPEDMVQIGQGTATNKHLPVEPFYKYTYSQSIFLQSEINVADQRISTLYYHYNGNSAWTDDIVVYMGHTNLATFDSSSAWVPLARNLVEVYSGPMSVPSVDSWIEIVLDSPFNYNNVDNLVIACDENTGVYHSSSDEFYCTSTDTFSRSIYFYADILNPDPANPPDGTTSTYCPNVRLLFEEIPPVPVMTLSDSTYDFGWVEEGATPSWDVSITNSGSVELIISDVTINPPFSCVYPDTILPGNTEVATIYLDASNPGVYEDVLTFNYNAIGGNTIELSAIVYGADYVIEGFEDHEFPPFDWINDDEYWNRYTDNAYSGEGYARCSWAHICDACLISPRLIIESGDFISFYWRNANLYDGKGGGKVIGADTTYFEITDNLCNDNWETLAILAPDEEMTEYEHVIVPIPEAYVGNMARVRWRHTTELSVESRGVGLDEVMSPPLYHPVIFYLDPIYQSDYDALETTVEYSIDIYNTGVQPDRYFISVAGSKNLRDVLIDEGFEGATFPPTGWSEINHGTATGWFQDYYGSGSYEPPGGTGSFFANCDSDANGPGVWSSLFTPSLDLSGGAASIEFVYTMQDYAGGGYAELNVYSGGTGAGNFEEQLWTETNDNEGFLSFSFDPSGYANPSDVYIEFMYDDESVWAWNFAIDDVLIEGTGGGGPAPEGWPAYVEPVQIDIDPGQMGTFTAYVEIPEDVLEDDVNVTTVNVESRDCPWINHTADVKTTAHPKDPYEPNNTLADATPFAYGDVTEGAQIYYNPDYDDNDVDIYTFDGLEGDVVYTLFDVADTLLFDGAIALLDADSVMLAYADSYAGGVSEALQYRLLNDGTFYVKLGGWSEVLEGPFKKTVLRTQTTTYYTMSLDLIPSPDVLVEPEELTMGIIQNGKDIASDILYITNTGDEGAINLDWDIEVYIPGIEILLNEGFEGGFPPDGWQNIMITGHAWEQSSAYAHSGTYSAKYKGTSSGGTGELITPPVDLTLCENDILSFYIKNKVWAGDQNVCYLYISTDGGTIWTLIHTFDTDMPNFEYWEFDLESYDQTDNTFFKFAGEDNWGYGIYIDDVYMATGEPWAFADPESGSVPQGATRTSTITCDDDAKGLDPGVYYADIIIHNNALLYGVSDIIVPLTLNVGESSAGLEGTVTFITTGDPIDSVKVSCGNFVTYTDSNGFYQFDPAPPVGTYNIHYEKSGFEDLWVDDVPLGPTWIITLNVQMNFDGPKPRDLVAEGLHLCIDLTWRAPSTGGTTQVEYILDDGSYENGWTGNPGYELWFGNLFPVDDTGELISFDLYTEFNASAGSDLLEIDIFDAAHNLVGSSESFVPVPDTWTTISCPNVPFDGEFYAMIHFNNESAQSHWMGFDENGPNANAGLDWYTDGTTWALLHVVASADPGVFMLRATAMVQGELREITVGDVDHTPAVLPGDEIASICNSFSSKSTNNPHHLTLPGELDSYEVTTSTRDLVLEGYNVYREDEGFLDYIPVEDPRYYRDEIVAVGIEYTYWVTAVYTVGESGHSNHASAIPIIIGGWEETFDIDWHLTGWTVDPISPNNWEWHSSSHSARLNWSPSVTNYDMSLISPPIVLPDDPIDVYDLTVSMYLNNYTSSAGEVWEISLIHDGVEDVLWMYDDPTADWGSSGGTDWVFTDLYLYAGETVQIKFRSYGGDTFNFDYWYVYNVLFDYADVPPEYGALQGIVTDGYMVPIEGAELTVIGDLHPLGRYVVYTDDLGYYEIDPIIAQEYDLTCVATGFTTYTAQFEVPPDSTVVHDIIMGNPEIEVTPDFVTITLDPNTQGTEFLTIINAGNAPLGWYANIEEPDLDLGIFSGLTSSSSQAEIDPNQTGIYNPPTKDMWDILFAYDVDTPSGLAGLVSAETDGSYLYTTKWSGSGEIAKFDLEGNYIETFYIAGVEDLRDLAYDGTYFYGSDASNYIWQMDFDTHTLVNTIPCPASQVRSIAYDDDNDAFWVNNWDSDIKLVDRSGNVLNTIPAPPSMYGSAYDNISDGGPYLWIFTGTSTGGGCQVEQYDLNTLALTGIGHSVSGDFPGTIAGGLFTSGDIVPGIWILGGLAQGSPDILFGYELCPYTTWIRIEPTSGTVPPGGDSLVTVYFDATDLEVGTIKTADIHFFSIPDVGEPIVAATLIVGTPEYGNLDGTVTDAGTTNPIEGVLVTATSSGKQVYTDITDVNGYYLIEDMLIGIYDVTFENEGYNVGLEPGVLIENELTTTVNYTMTAPELTFTPISFLFDLEPGNIDTDTLAIENIGTGPVDFTIDIDYVTENRQTILCVDRDGSSTTGYTDDWPYFQAALDAAGYTYTYYEVVDIALDGPDLATMQAYEVIIWFSGEAWGYFGHDCMTDNDEMNLGIYLEGGGTLFLSAQDYFWASYPSAGAFSAGQFPYDYLGMRSVAQDNWVISLPDQASIEGCAGSLAEGYNFFAQDIYTTDKEGLFIDWLTDHVGQDMFNVTSPTPEGICGIQYDASTFRTAFTTASFAAITDPVVQTDLIDDIIQYLVGGIPQWLVVNPILGTIDPFTIYELILTVNTTGLENGDYYANIVVDTENPDIGQTFIPVHLHVGPPAIGVGPEPIPTVTKLHSNFPNPFGHSTKISFSLKEKSHVNLSVYNMRGQLVATLIDNEMDPAIHEVAWDGNNAKGRLASGIYFYRLEADKKTFIKKMLLMR